MPPRAYWKGHLKLSVSPSWSKWSTPKKAQPPFPSASFRTLRPPHQYEKVVQGLGKIETSDIVKGYETGKDTYVYQAREQQDA